MTGLGDINTTEQRLLGAAMVSPEIGRDVVQVLVSGNFRSLRHATIFDSIRTVWHRTRGVDPVAVAQDLTDRGLFAAVDGLATLESMIAAADAVHWSDIDFLTKHTPVGADGA